jgi:hypothetical protein
VVGAAEALATNVTYSDSDHDPQQVLADLPADDEVPVQSVSREEKHFLLQLLLGMNCCLDLEMPCMAMFCMASCCQSPNPTDSH